VSAPADLGVHLPDERPGKYRLACPECGKGKNDDALQVTVTPRRWAFWRCWRCGWEGGAPRRGPGPRLRPVGSRPALSPGGLSAWAQDLLRDCRPVTADSVAGVYFRARGCAPPGNDVLWHPALRHPVGHVGPALVAVVTDALTGERISLHRTWLARTAAARPTSPGRGCCSRATASTAGWCACSPTRS
jgi:hypothetical protein